MYMESHSFIPWTCLYFYSSIWTNHRALLLVFTKTLCSQPAILQLPCCTLVHHVLCTILWCAIVTSVCTLTLTSALLELFSP